MTPPRKYNTVRFIIDSSNRSYYAKVTNSVIYSDDSSVVGNGITEPLGVYVISVASRLLNMHPQTLRKYERLGLISPSRSSGMLRLYSIYDIARLRMIKHLVENKGLNLAGVEVTLDIVSKLLYLRSNVKRNLEIESADILLKDIDGIFDNLHFDIN
jgi:MerR family transcriptional regulator/heat shock protein HspR